MTFTQAIAQLKLGRKVRRRGKGWIRADQYGHYMFIADGCFWRVTDEDRWANDWEVG